MDINEDFSYNGQDNRVWSNKGGIFWDRREGNTINSEIKAEKEIKRRGY